MEEHADEDDAQRQQKEQQNQRRALTEPQVLEGDAIDCNRHHLRGPSRAALGHYEDQREVVDHPDGGEEEDYPDHVFELSWKSPLLA